MAHGDRRWGEFAAAQAPELAEAGRRLLYQHGPGLGYLATVRPDGGPRVHPVCPHVAEARLWVFVGHASPKRFDLQRDPRYALHTFPCVDVDDEFFVTGEADAARRCGDGGDDPRVAAVQQRRRRPAVRALDRPGTARDVCGSPVVAARVLALAG